MSAHEQLRTANLPEFEMDYNLDDYHHPSEVTLFPTDPGASIFTAWITIDLDHAVPAEEWR